MNALKNILAAMVGVVVGSLLNGAIITIGPMLIPPPDGADMTTVEGLTAAMPLLEPRHFLGPFLAHALGTFAGACIASVLAVSHRTAVAYSVGALFLCGGIIASVMIPAPVWFIAVDLLLAYIPMAWLALMLADRVKPRAAV